MVALSARFVPLVLRADCAETNEAASNELTCVNARVTFFEGWGATVGLGLYACASSQMLASGGRLFFFVLQLEVAHAVAIWQQVPLGLLGGGYPGGHGWIVTALAAIR